MPSLNKAPHCRQYRNRKQFKPRLFCCKCLSYVYCNKLNKLKIMALNYTGVAVNLVSAKVPTGYTKPIITPITGAEYSTLEKTILIDKSTVEAATAVDTFTALVAALDTAIDTMLSADFDVALNTVDASGTFNAVNLNSCGAADTSLFYLNTVPSYVCEVVVLVKTTVI